MSETETADRAGWRDVLTHMIPGAWRGGNELTVAENREVTTAEPENYLATETVIDEPDNDGMPVHDFWQTSDRTAVASQPPPATAEEYSLPKVDGHSWTDADWPSLRGFLEIAAKHGVSQAAVDDLGRWYVATTRDAETAVADAFARKDAQDVAQVAEGLRRAWPEQDIGRNLQTIERWISDQLGGSAWRAIENARLPDGRRLIHDATLIRWVHNLASRAVAEARDPRNRLAEIEHVMRTDIARYHREKMGDERLRLLGSTAPGVASDQPYRSSRRQEIEYILQHDPRRYWAENLDVEYQSLLREGA